MICEYCNKEYSNKGNVGKHQKSSKKCLKIQNNLHKCNYCNFKTTLNNDYIIHMSKCKEEFILNENKTLTDHNVYLQHEYDIMTNKNESLQKMYHTLQQEYVTIKKINTLLQKKTTKVKEINNVLKQTTKNLKEVNYKIQVELEIKNNRILFIETEYTDLKQQLKENLHTLILKPSYINQSTTNKLDLMVNFNNDFIEKAVEDNFTLTHVEEGIKGFAKFTNDYIINKENGQSKYICSDTSRTIFKYKDENGVIQKDIKAIKLKNSMKDPIIKKSKMLFDNESCRLLTEMTKENEKEQVTIKHNMINHLTKQFLKIKHINDHEDEYAKELVLYLN